MSDIHRREVRIKKEYKDSLPEASQNWYTVTIRIYECICENLFKPELTIAYILDQLDIKSNGIYSKFNYNIGMSPSNFIRYHRVQCSKQLFKGIENYKVGRCAHCIGYRDISTFSKAFKEVEGVPPSEWKKNNY